MERPRSFHTARPPAAKQLGPLCRATLLLLALVGVGCGELRARRHAREGNRLFLDGKYAQAAKEYEFAERLLPTLGVITLNHGLACRQMMVPGAKSTANEHAVQCALDAFKRLQKNSPKDPRGEQLYLQTLFDAERYDQLSAHYTALLAKRPNDLEAINGLVQVSSRADRWEDALRWTLRRAEVASHDAEAQYSVGVFVWNRLFQKGGNGERASIDPRPEAKQAPIPFAEGDIAGAERVRLADVGISYLEKALALRANYRDAMVNLNLLYRQKSLAFFDNPEQWLELVNQAISWQKKARELAATPGAPVSTGPAPSAAPTSAGKQ